MNPKTRQKVVVLGWTCLAGPSTRGKSQNDFEQLPSTGLQPPSTTQFGCSPAKECPVSPSRVPCATFGWPCPKSFGERCALEGLIEGVVSPNAAKSASLVTNVPCRPLWRGYFHQTILNNCHVCTIRHSGSSRRYTSGAKPAWNGVFLPDVTRQENPKVPQRGLEGRLASS